MSRSRLLALIVCASLLAGCGSVLEGKSEQRDKKAVTIAAATHVVADFNRVRAGAEANLDTAKLKTIEATPVLAIDTGAFTIRRELGASGRPLTISNPGQLLAGRFDTYPLWFVVVADVVDEQTQVAAVFQRSTSTSPWLLVAAPRLAADTQIPLVRSRDDGSVELVDGSDADGLTASPDALVRKYAEVLDDPTSEQVGDFEADSFIKQMRAVQAAQPSGNVTFSQTWQPRPVAHAIRLADGGALIFASLRRVDQYQVQGKHSLQFKGSAAGAFLAKPARHSARLTYEHQVLLYAPPGGKPLAIGQYGGLTAAVGR